MNKDLRKEKEKEFKKAIIIDAALEIISQKGFNNTTVAEIAKAAGFAKGTFYLYFKTKMEVMGEIYYKFSQENYEQVAKIIEQKVGALEKLEMVVDFFYEFQKKLVKYKLYDFFYSFQNIQKFFEFQQAHSSDAQTKLRLVFEDIIKEGQKEKIFDPSLNPTSSAILIRILMKGVFNNMAFARFKEVSDKEVISECLKFIINSLSIKNKE